MHYPNLSALLLVCPCLAAISAQTASPILQAYQRAERFGSAEMSKLVYKASVEAHWIGDTPRFWYRNDVRGRREFVLVDAEAGTRQPAFDHERLAAALGKALGKNVDPARLPFTAISLGDGMESVVFVAEGRAWRCNLTTYECDRVANGPSAGGPPRTGETPLPQAPEPQEGESPDGKWVAFVREANVFFRPRAGGEETRLTSEGVAGNAFGALFWSPDSQYIVAWRTQPGDPLKLPVIESAPAGQLRPKLREYEYGLPGDKVDVHELWVIDVAARKAIKANADPVDWGGPPGLHWWADGRHFSYEHTSRGYQRVRVMEVDVATGQSRAIIDEQSATFVFPPAHCLHYVNATRELIWASERDGYNHLYLIDADTGQVKAQITRGKWVVRSVEEIDEARRTITFAASGREQGQDPYLLHYYRVGFDGTGLVRLTRGHGQHSLRYSPDKRFYVDTFSRVDRAPVTELRRSEDGGLVCRLEQADVDDLLATGWQWPEPFRAKGRDGRTDIWGVIYRPSTLDPVRKYPVIEDIYAGPQGSFVPKTFSAQSATQALAELGFIVVKIDGMGTANRSKAFHDVAWHNLGDSGFPDRIAWLRAAALKYPYMDLTRVGIYGHSAGGYNAARALIAHPEVYKVAVAMSGNHDHRTDKTWWNELWMGYPVGAHYAEQSNIENAAKLRGKLLLVHGEVDDNVNPHISTLRFADALIKANKDFDLLIVPGAGHGFNGTYVQRRMWDYFVRHLQGVEPPLEYRFKAPADNSCHITIRNAMSKPVAVFWVNFERRLQKYHDLQPGQEIKQHTYIGHEWEAQVEGKAVSWYTASVEAPAWVIGPEP